MKFTVASVVAFAAAVLAKPVLLNSNYDIVEGEPFTLKWSNAQGPVTITLMTGPAKALTKVTDLTTGETGEEFTFTLDDLPSGTYAIRITDESEEPNYSVQFEYEGTAVATTSSSVTTSSSTTVSSTESSSTESSESSTTTSEESTTTTSSTSTTQTASPTDDDEDTEETTPPLINNGQRFASPLALVLGAVAALMFFN